MNLREWTVQKPLGQRGNCIARIAKGCDVAPSAVRHWISGKRSIHPKYWETIVGITHGEVTISDLLANASAEPDLQKAG